MKINEILDDQINNGIDYFTLVINENDFLRLSIIEEGIWKKNRNYSYRIDSPDPALKQQRHIHIAKSKHINAKSRQVSWNKDGTRHDKKTFNQNLGNVKAVRAIAKDVLGIDDNITLESLPVNYNEYTLLTESPESNLKAKIGVFKLVLN